MGELPSEAGKNSAYSRNLKSLMWLQQEGEKSRDHSVQGSRDLVRGRLLI